MLMFVNVNARNIYPSSVFRVVVAPVNLFIQETLIKTFKLEVSFKNHLA